MITCYTPTNEVEEEDRGDFYTLLSSELSSVPPHDSLVHLGDMNASILNESGLWGFAVGSATVDSLKDNRERMLNCCLAHSLTFVNTWLQRPSIANYTWYSNDGSTKKMLDYIILRRRWLSSVQNCRTYRGAELGNTDHCFVATKIKIRLKAIKPARHLRKLTPTVSSKTPLWLSSIRSKYTTDLSL